MIKKNPPDPWDPALTVKEKHFFFLFIMFDVWLLDITTEWNFDSGSFTVGMMVTIYIVMHNKKGLGI